jgi:hypothetical protein
METSPGPNKRCHLANLGRTPFKKLKDLGCCNSVCFHRRPLTHLFGFFGCGVDHRAEPGKKSSAKIKAGWIRLDPAA